MNSETPIDDRIRITLREKRRSQSMLARTRQVVVLALLVVLLLVWSILMAVVGAATLFRARRFYAEVMARILARIALWLHGVRLQVHGALPQPSLQVVYISNHTSALDPIVILAMGLPNCRYFMGGFLRKVIPIWIIGSLIGMYWTPLQREPKKRRELFIRASEELRRRNESVFLTPEGQIAWRFNRGAFHLAMSLGAPIVPFFIHIPNEVDPGPWVGGRRMEIRRGRVDVFFGEVISTRDWKLEEIDARRLQARAMYLDWARALGDKSAEAPEAAEPPLPSEINS